MRRQWVRGRGLVAAVLAAGAVGLAAAPAASAADKDLGWLRVSPAAGAGDIQVNVLTEKPCPEGSWLMVKLSGPGVPTDDPNVGFLVGNLDTAAFKPTLSGQLLVPLSSTLNDWFQSNGVTRQAGKTYVITLVCRDKLSSSKVFGTFSGELVFAKSGAYEALGEASKPFNTELKPTDPLGGIVPGQSGAPAVTESPAPASEPAATAPAATASAAPTAPPASGSAPAVTAAPAPDAGATTAAAPGSSSGTPTSLLLIGLVLLALAYGVYALVQRLRSPKPSDPAPADTTNDRVDVL